MLKICEHCGVEYPKKPNITYKVWDKSRFCSRVCMSAVNPGGYKLGMAPWNKGLKASFATRQKISQSQIGRKKSDESKEKQRQRMLGRKITWADKISKARTGQPGLRGADSPHWQGGKTHYLKLLRNSTEYKNWRSAVFTRDKYTCQHCGNSGVYIEADHIKPFAFFPEHRFNVSNGRTLCKPCHVKTDTYSKGALKYA